MLASERLARMLFERSARGAQTENVDLLHPEAEIAPSYEPSLILTADEVVAHLAGADEPRVMAAHGHNYIALDDERVIVNGDVHVRRAGGGFEYRQAVWAFVFRDGLIYRSWCVESMREAEARLAEFASTAQ
jgi:ketosteroid isomerase-like protein